MKSLFDLRGKICVVTGGAGLLGRAFVKALASHGGTVYIAENNTERAQKAVVALKRSQVKARFIPIDITEENSVIEGIQTLLKRHQRIDVWINNAYPRTDDWGTRFEHIPASSWQANINAHLLGYFICTQKAAESMKKRGGVIINMASIYGIIGPAFEIYQGTSMTMPAAYSAIKGGIISFSRYLAAYYGKYGIRINSIAAGGVENGQPRTFVNKYARKTLLGRMAKASDLGGAAVYLASDASAYVTGHNLVVDGGFSIA